MSNTNENRDEPRRGTIIRATQFGRPVYYTSGGWTPDKTKAAATSNAERLAANLARAERSARLNHVEGVLVPEEV